MLTNLWDSCYCCLDITDEKDTEIQNSWLSVIVVFKLCTYGRLGFQESDLEATLES